MNESPTIIPAHKDKDGYQVDPKSSCCGKRVVYLDPSINKFVPWTGCEMVLADLKCDRCSKTLRKISELKQEPAT